MCILPFSRRDNYSRTEANFDLILSFDIECSQIIMLFLVLAQYRSSSLKNGINLQKLTEGTSNTYLLHT